MALSSGLAQQKAIGLANGTDNNCKTIIIKNRFHCRGFNERARLAALSMNEAFIEKGLQSLVAGQEGERL